MDIDNMLKILLTLEGVERRGGLQNEADHVTTVRENVINILDVHGICRHSPTTCGEIALVHDIREIGLPIDVVKSMEAMCSSAVLEGLDILSRREGESSQSHFQRVLDSGNVNALVVKWADCMANSVYTDAEKDWHNKEFDYSYVIDQEKYLDRADQLLVILKSM